MFTADWCVDCRFIKPRLPELEEKHKEYTFISVDRDKFIDLCVELGIMGIPSFLVYKIWRTSEAVISVKIAKR